MPLLWYDRNRIFGNYSVGSIPRGDLECILTRNCEGTEQLRFLDKPYRRRR